VRTKRGTRLGNFEVSLGRDMRDLTNVRERPRERDKIPQGSSRFAEVTGDVEVEGPAHSIYLPRLRVSFLSPHSPYPYRAIIPICVEPPQSTLRYRPTPTDDRSSYGYSDRPSIDSSHSVPHQATSTYLDQFRDISS